MLERQSAAIVTVGSELVEGLRIDTNTAEIARHISRYGFAVREAISVGDDIDGLAETLSRLTSTYPLVIVTGGLGPTHDDITREAASEALGVRMVVDTELEESLKPFVARHSQPQSAEQVLAQALVLEGAEVFSPSTGTAAGQIIATRSGQLALLPGPPREMRPMLTSMLARFTSRSAEPHELGVTGWPESDVQQVAQDVLESFDGIRLTLLAKPGDVRVILFDEGVGEKSLSQAADAIASAIGPACYSVDGSTLAETIVREAANRNLTLAVAESCTGGMVAAMLTDVPGASKVFLGGVVAYSNVSKTRLLGVDSNILAEHGAVSQSAAAAMARGVREQFGADASVSITGIAGPSGATQGKPVGTVWFGLHSTIGDSSKHAEELKEWTGTSREVIRARATSYALDLLRREVANT